MCLFRFCLSLLLVLPLVACDGCKTYKDALLGDTLPALPRITSWETHLRAFSIAATRPPNKPLRYRVEPTCPLQYGFLWRRRSNAALRQQKKQPPKMAELQVIGRLVAKATKGRAWHLQLARWQVKRRGPVMSQSAAVGGDAMPQGGLVLETDGRSWSLAKGPKQPLQRLWRGAPERLSLATFWPDLPQAIDGYARDIKKKLPDGWLKARSFTRHWLAIEGEQVGVMIDQMQVQRRTIQLDQQATYVMSTRGHLIYARFRHRSWVLDPGRGDGGRTETSTTGELRLIRSCRELVLAPFVAR